MSTSVAEILSEAQETFRRVLPRELKAFLQPANERTPGKITTRTARLFSAFMEEAPEFSAENSKKPLVTEKEVTRWLKRIGYCTEPGHEDLTHCIVKTVQRLRYNVDMFESLNRRNIRCLVRAIESLRKDCGAC